MKNEFFGNFYKSACLWLEDTVKYDTQKREKGKEVLWIS